MIGFGCDRTNANTAQRGLRGLLTDEMSWDFVLWCLAFELSLKDALKPTFFCYSQRASFATLLHI